MSIKYTLQESQLATLVGAHTARVHADARAEVEDVVAGMLQHGSTVSKADILSVLEDYYDAVEYLLLDGRSISTPLANFRLAIGGCFQGPDDAYDPSRHRLLVRVSAGKRIRQTVPGQARVAKQDRGKALPLPLVYVDLASGERNRSLTPGGAGQLIGRRLRFDPADTRQGVFFVAPDGAAVRAAEVIKTAPAEVIVIAPALAAGHYTLELRATFNGGEQLRSGVLDVPLAVAPPAGPAV